MTPSQFIWKFIAAVVVHSWIFLVLTEPITPPTFSAVVAGRTVTVVGKRLCWLDAVFYCRDFYWDLRSQEEQMEVEKLLSNATFNLTSHLWLGLRSALLHIHTVMHLHTWKLPSTSTVFHRWPRSSSTGEVGG